MNSNGDITSCLIKGDEFGIYCTHESNVNVAKSTFCGNTTNIHIEGLSNAHIDGNVLMGADSPEAEDIGIYANNSYTLAENNICTNLSRGIKIEYNGDVKIRKIHLAKCLGNNDWSAIRKDLTNRPIENIDGKAPDEEIIKILDKYGIFLIQNLPASRIFDGVTFACIQRFWLDKIIFSHFFLTFTCFRFILFKSQKYFGHYHHLLSDCFVASCKGYES